MRIGDLEHAPRDIESSSWRSFNRASVETNAGIGSADPHSQVRIADWRQARDRVNSRSGGLDIDGQTVIRHWGPAVLEIFEGRVAGNHEALDGSAPNMIIDPGAYLAGSKYGPKTLQG